MRRKSRRHSGVLVCVKCEKEFSLSNAALKSREEKNITSVLCPTCYRAELGRLGIYSTAKKKSANGCKVPGCTASRGANRFFCAKHHALLTERYGDNPATLYGGQISSGRVVG